MKNTYIWFDSAYRKMHKNARSFILLDQCIKMPVWTESTNDMTQSVSHLSNPYIWMLLTCELWLHDTVQTSCTYESMTMSQRGTNTYMMLGKSCWRTVRKRAHAVGSVSHSAPGSAAPPPLDDWLVNTNKTIYLRVLAYTFFFTCYLILMFHFTCTVCCYGFGLLFIQIYKDTLVEGLVSFDALNHIS